MAGLLNSAQAARIALPCTTDISAPPAHIKTVEKSDEISTLTCASIPESASSRCSEFSCARVGFLQLTGTEMTDRRFYLLLTLLLLALGGGEVVYAMVGPLSEPTRLLDELSSINRVR